MRLGTYGRAKSKNDLLYYRLKLGIILVRCDVRAAFTNRFSVHSTVTFFSLSRCVSVSLSIFLPFAATLRLCLARFHSVRRICAWIVKSCAFCHENAMGIKKTEKTVYF